MEGKFITIEGTDGAGKTTQLQLLVKYFEDKNYKVMVTREPGGTSISEKIREIILDVENSKMNDITEALLYAASRSQLIHEKIKPALEEGTIVICDRFVDSSVVYQGYARGLSLELVENINKYAINEVVPDLTLFFDVPPEVGMKRKENFKHLDRIEKESLDFHYKVYNGYKDLLKKYPERIKAIDAQQNIEDVQQQVLKVVETLWQR
ncbi:MAG: dTMP kinase [Anaerotignaceae bacterium]